ncbi:MAG: hypothetical protein ABJQ29_15085 [Luteolibacter sp.]
MKIIAIVTLVFLLGLSTSLYSENADEPNELTSLRTNWIRARKQAINPIDRKYETALTELKVKLTKAAKLEEALQVDAELKKLLEDMEQSAGIETNIEDEIVGKWACSSSSGWSGMYHFLPKGEFLDGGGKWMIINGRKKLVIKWNSGGEVTYDLPPVDGVMTGVGSRGGIIKATKLK